MIGQNVLSNKYKSTPGSTPAHVYYYFTTKGVNAKRG